MKCHECDKPLTTDEVRECFSSCFACEVARAIGRLAHHVKQGRMSRAFVLAQLMAEIAPERTSGQ